MLSNVTNTFLAISMLQKHMVIGKNLKKNNHQFSEKKGQFFFKFFPMVPPMEFSFTLWYPKGSKKNWPKCHNGQSVSGQSVSGQSVTLAKVSFWPKFHWPKCLSGQSVFGQSVSSQMVTLTKVSFWPKCLCPNCVILAKV